MDGTVTDTMSSMTMAEDSDRDRALLLTARRTSRTASATVPLNRTATILYTRGHCVRASPRVRTFDAYLPVVPSTQSYKPG